MAPSMGSALDGKKRSRTIRKRDVFAYALLPRVMPRLGDLFLSGFHYFAFFMAQVYRGVRLLPDGHPSLNPANIGEYGIRDVITEAGRHLVWKRENIDQILVYVAILFGLVLLALQAATFIIAFALPSASADSGPSGFSAIFGTPAGGSSQDIAFILLDRVFGVPGVFNSCVSNAGGPCYGVDPKTLGFDTDAAHAVYKPATFPWPYHLGLQALFQFYSMGLLLVGIFILLYYVIVIVAETAQTGTPFGKRFNTVWAPLRLVMAFGLLIPITNGLNSAQFITLYAAKFGSNFATNGWIVFNHTINSEAANMAGGSKLAIKPKEADVMGLLQSITLAQTCKVYEETLFYQDKVVRDPKAKVPDDTDSNCKEDDEGTYIDAYLVKPGVDAASSVKNLEGTSYDDAIKFSENSDIQIRFGDHTCKKSYAMAGNIDPICGEITIPINSTTEIGAKTIQKGYYELVQYLWGGYGTTPTPEGSYKSTQWPNNKNMTACTPSLYNARIGKGGDHDRTLREYALAYFQEHQCVVGNSEPDKSYQSLPYPPTDWGSAAFNNYMYGSDAGSTTESNIHTDVTKNSAYAGGDNTHIIRNILKHAAIAVQDAVDAGDYNVSTDNLKRGWAVAGIWYNKIAEMNGSLIGAAWDMPAANRYPQIMMFMLAEKKQNNSQVSSSDMFCPQQAGGDVKSPQGDSGSQYAATMCKVYNDFQKARPLKPTGNILSDFINAIFGTQGLFDLRFGDNANAHPLAQLVGVGKGLIEASIRNLGIGLGSGLLGMVSGLLTGGNAGPELMNTISSFFFTIATMTLTAGFILFYVIPFLPFLYFFFAVGNWLKGVFEAMVGVPLWALAHLRIDGNGLPGDAAMNGYYMLFEIFLRPIIILFGFVASITIFSAMASVLHEVFNIAVDNLTGTAGSGAGRSIDTFFYTVMYAVIMYIMALSSFKLIDLIPNQIMRWMGSSVSTFSDMQQDVAGNLTNMTAIAGSQVTGQLAQGVGGAMKGMSTAATSIGRLGQG